MVNAVLSRSASNVPLFTDITVTGAATAPEATDVAHRIDSVFDHVYLVNLKIHTRRRLSAFTQRSLEHDGMKRAAVGQIAALERHPPDRGPSVPEPVGQAIEEGAHRPLQQQHPLRPGELQERWIVCHRYGVCGAGGGLA